MIPDGGDAADLSRIADAVAMARDLINTPSNDMGPAELHEAARLLAEKHDAWIEAVTDSELLLKNFPLIHAVGRASSRPPRLIDLRWGDKKHPKVTLVGKGVCFDTGGLDLKPESAMLLMKKDMGGAATALALAHMVMDRKLPVSLRVLIPAVENSVSGSAFRPLDIYPSRKGITVEIGNTDAEGRLVLADALTLADEDKPDLLIDFGTLTGAARVALGPELVPFYTGDDAIAASLSKHAASERDPLWRMPLWAPYDTMLDSKVADTSNVGTGAFAGSILCALFLKKFVSDPARWLHFDIYGWNPSSKPGRPEGGECQAARAAYAYLCERYG
jgi:leucyl aminopeptidase